jgi:hypothetical protein
MSEACGLRKNTGVHSGIPYSVYVFLPNVQYEQSIMLSKRGKPSIS